MMARRIAGVAALAVISVLMAATCAAGRDFYVGGGGGWAPNPAEPFNAWAERNRFQVNDTLVFRYNKDADAVVVVSQGHYDACDATQPALRLDGGGESRFVFRDSGPYFFISPDEARCRAGERLIVVVLAVRNNGGGGTPSSPPSPPPADAPAPGALPSSTPPPPPPSKTSSPPPPPAPHAPLPPTPPPHHAPGKNSSSPSPSQSPAPAPAPGPGTKNGTSSPPPSPSSTAVAAFRGGFLACLLIIIGGAAILV